ncbi:MAG: septum formation protein Maf [Deltaproteobacteria bacterium]|nr:MAG: septum formation protein Maf [Deltaproteobacteria bacterium]
MEEQNYIVLASSSPRRERLLELTGIPFRTVPPGDDPPGREWEDPESFVVHSALGKASRVSELFPDRFVLGADTVVVLDGEILGKPETPEKAASMLRRLSGRSHLVYTGLALVHRALGLERRAVEVTRVWFSPLTEDEIRAYVSTGEPLDKAGAYGIQEKGGVFVERIEGSYTNVVGLPLATLTKMLREEGFIVPGGERGVLYRLRESEYALKGEKYGGDI